MRPRSNLTAVALARTPIARGAAWLVLAAQGTGFFLQMYARMARPTGNDLGARLASARILVDGGNPYTLELPQGHGPVPPAPFPLLLPLQVQRLAARRPLAVGNAAANMLIASAGAS